MYIAIVVLTMFLLSSASVLIERAVHPAAPSLLLVGRWFAFWGVGVRLGLAGVRHAFEPDRSLNENVAMVSDLGMAVVLAGFLAGVALQRFR